MSNAFSITANYVDVLKKEIYEATVSISHQKITNIQALSNQPNIALPYLLPGFVDAHVHIESSMLVPAEFAKMAVLHGTVATVSDPHEIANVCGVAGVEYMIQNGKQLNFKFNFGAPSCVPATVFETAGAVIDSQQVKLLLQNQDIRYLTEMMNYPGVLYGDAEVMQKIKYAQEAGKPIDGHAPALRGEQAKQYINAGITTDHECTTYEEAAEKLSLGMKILIREGSAAKNFDELIALLSPQTEDSIMFCSDDKHPDDLELGHINKLCARAVAKGINVFSVLKAASVNTVKHYNLPVGLLQKNDAADFVLVNNLQEFCAIETYINGELVMKNGTHQYPTTTTTPINNFNCEPIGMSDILVDISSYNNHQQTISVIQALDGQLITNAVDVKKECLQQQNYLASNPAIDVLKIVVLNRYAPNQKPAVAFIKNFGLKQGAIAGSIAHDSHNIVAIGVTDQDICTAINAIVNSQGGIAACHQNTIKHLPLPIAGLMSNNNGKQVAAAYTEIDGFVKQQLGSQLKAPFMTLSFMCLLVIPHIKLSDKGLFNGDSFTFY